MLADQMKCLSCCIFGDPTLFALFATELSDIAAWLLLASLEIRALEKHQHLTVRLHPSTQLPWHRKDTSDNILEPLSDLLVLRLVSLLFGRQVRKLRGGLKLVNDIDKSRL